MSELILRNRQRAPEFALQLRNNVQNAIQRVIFQKTRINPVVLGVVSYVDNVQQPDTRRAKQREKKAAE